MLHFLLKSHCGIKGFIIDDATSTAIKNASVSVEDYKPVTSSKDGEYWKILLPGNRRYRVVSRYKGKPFIHFKAFSVAKATLKSAMSLHSFVRHFVIKTPQS